MDNSNQATNQQSRYYVTVEGNIAIGKSTFITRLREQLGADAVVFNEPIDLWTNFKGVNLLNEMYNNPISRSFHIQSYIQLTMAIIQQTQVHPPIKVMERSLNSGRFIFTEVMRHQKHIDSIEYELLNEWFQWLDPQSLPTNQIIYLRASPEISMRRLRQRNRAEETPVTLEYLQLIHNLYEKWLSDSDIPVKVINQDQDLSETLSAADELAEELKSKIYPHLLGNINSPKIY